MKEFEQLMDYLGLSSLPETASLLPLAVTHRLKKHERLCMPGSRSHFLLFLLSGIARSYRTDERGREITDRFLCQYGQPCLCTMDTAVSPAPAENVEALTDATLLCFDTSVLTERIPHSLPLSNLYSRLMLDAFSENWQHKSILYRSDAKSRYHWFLEAYPGLMEQVPHKYIASFLDMTPVTLSRLRRAEKKCT